MPTYKTQQYVTYDGQLARVKSVALATGGPLLTLATKSGDVTVAAVEVKQAGASTQLLQLRRLAQEAIAKLQTYGGDWTSRDTGWVLSALREMEPIGAALDKTYQLAVVAGAPTFYTAMAQHHIRTKDPDAALNSLRHLMAAIPQYARVIASKKRSGKSTKDDASTLLQALRRSVFQAGSMGLHISKAKPAFRRWRGMLLAAARADSRIPLYYHAYPQLVRLLSNVPDFTTGRLLGTYLENIVNLLDDMLPAYQRVHAGTVNQEAGEKSTAADALDDTLDNIRRYAPDEARQPEVGQIQEAVNAMGKSTKGGILTYDQLADLIGQREAYHIMTVNPAMASRRTLDGRSVTIIQLGRDQYQVRFRGKSTKGEGLYNDFVLAMRELGGFYNRHRGGDFADEPVADFIKHFVSITRTLKVHLYNDVFEHLEYAATIGDGGQAAAHVREAITWLKRSYDRYVERKRRLAGDGSPKSAKADPLASARRKAGRRRNFNETVNGGARLDADPYRNTWGKYPSRNQYGLWMLLIDGQQYSITNTLEKAARQAVQQHRQKNPNAGFLRVVVQG